jgi:hypothetical protein
MKSLSGLSETDRMAAACAMEMNLNDVYAETTHTLVDAAQLIKAWTMQRLRDLILEEENAEEPRPEKVPF